MYQFKVVPDILGEWRMVSIAEKFTDIVTEKAGSKMAVDFLVASYNRHPHPRHKWLEISGQALYEAASVYNLLPHEMNQLEIVIEV